MMFVEDVKPGYAPKQISFGGYTTKHFHHVPEAAKAFEDTIDRVGSTHPQHVLAALKATDAYMAINDMHMQEGEIPDEQDIKRWNVAHKIARDSLHRVGEFTHHVDYWHAHEHELHDLLANYNLDTAGAEMAESHIEHLNRLEEDFTKMATSDLKKWIAIRQRNALAANLSKQRQDQYKQAHAELKKRKSNPDSIEESLTDKTVKSSDKIKVARVIADMLGVENPESMSPEAAVNAGLRKIKSKKLTPEFVGVIKKMLALANDVGVKIDTTLVPKTVVENNLEYSDDLEDEDFMLDDSEGGEEAEEADQHQLPAEVGQVGHGYGHAPHENTKRHMKVKYTTEEVDSQSSEFVPVELSNDELDSMADTIDHEDDILDLYDEDELHVIDTETQEAFPIPKEEVNEQLISEVLSRAARIKARVRFMQTAGRREAKLKVALRRHSDIKTLTKRAHRLAIKMLKEKFMRKPVAQMSIVERERAESILQSNKGLVSRLALRLIPKVAKIEHDRLSHEGATQKMGS